MRKMYSKKAQNDKKKYTIKKYKNDKKCAFNQFYFISPPYKQIGTYKMSTPLNHLMLHLMIFLLNHNLENI